MGRSLLLCVVWAAVLVGNACSQSSVQDYNESLAFKYVVFAGSPYCYRNKKFNISTWAVSEECLRLVPRFNITKHFYRASIDAFAFVGVSESEKLVVVSVKGTTPSHIVDWIIDFKSTLTFKSVCDIGGVLDVNTHAGFCQEYSDFLELGIMDEIFRLHELYPNYQVLATGHSLGAAVASLIGLELVGRNVSTLIYTYGQPRTGAEAYVNEFARLLQNDEKSVYFRISHFRDPVPVIPPCKEEHKACFLDYIHPYHAGRHIHYNETMPGPHLECSPLDGTDCHVTSFSAGDHSYYFGVQVSTLCCPSEFTESDKAVYEAINDEDAPIILTSALER